MISFILAVVVSVKSLGAVAVIDGDTIAVSGQRIRILGLDAPEMHGRCQSETSAAFGARDRLVRLLDGARTVEIIPSRRHDRYRRILARILIDGRDVAEILVGEGLARPYNGGRRQGWC